jgi:quercetin dioxygenase-like cupin family protein
VPFAHWDEIEPLVIWDGVVGRAVDGQEATLAAIELQPNVSVPEHRHPNEQMGMLLRGTLTFRIGEETQELRPGSSWVVPGDVPHQVDAGPDGAFLIELLAPPRHDWAGLRRLDPSPPPAF